MPDVEFLLLWILLMQQKLEPMEDLSLESTRVKSGMQKRIFVHRVFHLLGVSVLGVLISFSF